MGKILRKKQSNRLKNLNNKYHSSDTCKIVESFKNLNINNQIIHKIYINALRNTIYCIKKYNIKFNIINYKGVIGCSKNELYNHIIKNVNNRININDYKTWTIGHINAFDIRQRDNRFYVHNYFNYRNLCVERKKVK